MKKKCYSELPSALWKWDALDLAGAIREGEVSCREVAQSCFERLYKVNPRLNAVIAIDEEGGMAAANAADGAIALGQSTGPLHGVPVTIKNNVDQRGFATTNGVTAWKDLYATEDSPPVAALRRAGAIILGRTNTPPLSLRWVSSNDLYGATLNPWSVEHTPGGSSGGAAVAVAVGIGPIAHANDLYGSIRFPAFCTGTVGLRPTWGRTPFFNGTSLAERGMAFQSMAVQGPIVRRVRDALPALKALSVPDPRDAMALPVTVDWEGGAVQKRVALSVDPTQSGTHPAIANALRKAAGLLEACGYEIVEIDPPDAAEAAEVAENLNRFDQQLLSAPNFRDMLDAASRRHFDLAHANQSIPTAYTYASNLARRATIVRRWALFLEKYPILLCPNFSQPIFRLGEDEQDAQAWKQVRAAHALAFAIPLAGVPSIAVPTGLYDGMPIGIQLVGRRFREDTIVAAAEIIEAGFPRASGLDYE